MSYLNDTFLDSPGTALGTTPDASGVAWTVVDGTPFSGGSGVGAYGTTAGENLWIAPTNLWPTSSSHSVAFAVAVFSGGASIAVVVRYTDQNNYVTVSWYAGQVYLQKCVAGTTTTVVQAALSSIATGDVLNVVNAGSTVAVQYNGSALISAQTLTDSALISGLGVGLRQYNVSSASTGIHAKSLVVSQASTPQLSVSPTSATAIAGGAAVSLTATRLNSTAALTVDESGSGTLSTGAPVSGTAFTWTPPSSGSGTTAVTVHDPTDGLNAVCNITYGPPPVSHTFSQSDFFDNNRTGTITANSATYIDLTPGASARYSTTATAVSLTLQNTTTETINGRVGVRLNGVDPGTLGSIAVPSAGQNVIPVNMTTLPGYLSGSANLLELLQGSATLGGGGLVLSSILTAIAFTGDASPTRIAPAVLAGHISGYGDSILTGAYTYASISDTTTPAFMLTGYAALMRARLGAGSFTTECYGSRQLASDVTTQGQAATLAALMVSSQAGNAGAHNYLIAIGTNDYALGGYAASTFGTRYGWLVDAIKAADAAAVIYCMSPFIRATETANGAGSTLDDFRSAISAVCGTRSFCRYINGKPILPLARISDAGVHPDTAGHAMIAEYLLGVFFGTTLGGGTATYTAVANVLAGVDRGDGQLGTFAYPPIADVASGYQYGAGGTQFTGTLVAGSGSGSDPWATVLSAGGYGAGTAGAVLLSRTSGTLPAGFGSLAIVNGKIQIDLTQLLTLRDLTGVTAPTVGDGLAAAAAGAAGAEDRPNTPGTTVGHLKHLDGSTARTFTFDSGTNPSTRS